VARNVKHLSLHRIAGTELRVVADMESGVLPLIQVEEAVIRSYIQRKIWPHRWVTLFILTDLQSLARQIEPSARLPLGSPASLGQRPVVNVYDLANPASCHVFVNRQIMEKEGYWSDPIMAEGLLAHEHAHPLAENATTRATRDLQVQLKLDQPVRFDSVLRSLATTLTLVGPREVFTNELAIRCGFSKALFALDRQNVANAARSIVGRKSLARRLKEEVESGKLTAREAGLILLVGDLESHLGLAMETAAFYRAGRESDGRKLDVMLNTRVFPGLEPETAPAYTALREQYTRLRPDLDPAGMQTWGTAVLAVLVQALASKGLILNYEWIVTQNRTDGSDFARPQPGMEE
jgi:hypothetical protein